MFAISSSSFRKGAIALTTAAFMGTSALAQSMLSPTPIANTATAPSAPVAQVIPKEHCTYLFGVVDRELLKRGKDFLSPSTRRDLKAFFAFDATKLPTCTGSSREISWERGDDYDFVIALADSAYLAFGRKTDFRMGYGLKPAARPTASTTPGQRSELPTGPKTN